MRLSVIVPVYNSPQDLRECLAARNYGASQAEGDILFFVGADIGPRNIGRGRLPIDYGTP